MEESDRAQERGAVELGGCADAFTEGALVAAFGELGRALELRKVEAQAQAKARLDALERRLPAGGAVKTFEPRMTVNRRVLGASCESALCWYAALGRGGGR